MKTHTSQRQPHPTTQRMPARSHPRQLALLFVITALGGSAIAAENPPPGDNPPGANEGFANREAPPANPGGSFSASADLPRPPWLRRLTLGPGDVLNLSMYGEPDLTRTEVFIGPDGRISYLEAQDVQAAGLTIDELRDKLDEALSEYRRVPRTIVTPVDFKSKKYFVLGGVTRMGAYTLRRPVTIIEAVARAEGIETGISEGNIVNMADYSRSFLAREGNRVDVDFERLFQHGDLSENQMLAPGDYLYFAPPELKRVYVLGEVLSPGILDHSSDISAMAAIAARGGFTEQAWKRKILLVRGSLNNPETIEINSHDVLAAREADERLEPGDILYVSRRPWVKAEELLDTATSAFIQAAVIVWTGGNVGPLVK